jgi:LPS-assembly protein
MAHPSAGAAVSPPLSDENIHINADRMSQDQADGSYIAEGNVVVRWQGQTLTADTVRYAAQTRMMSAHGSVALTKGVSVLTGTVLTMNIDTGRGEMDSTLLTVSEPGMKISSEKLIRVDENLYNTISSEFTSCDLSDPSWKFSADKLTVNLAGYASGRGVLFYVKDIPILYLPWIAYPVLLEKSSGLLFPRVGNSKKRGFQLDIPLYLVISPSQDLQLDLDVQTKRGVGIGLDYRYIRKRGSEGHVTTYGIYDQNENRWRGQVAQEHKEIFSPNANLRMTVNVTSDRTFLNDYGEKSGEYNRQSTDTTLNTLNTWDSYAVTSSLRYSENLYAANNKGTVQTLPSLGVAAVRRGIFSLPLYFDLDGSADNLYRVDTPRGQRAYLFPRMTLLPFRNNYLQTSLFAGAHIRGYATEWGDTGRANGTEGDLLPEAGIRISTSLTRSYDAPATMVKKIRHEIIPELSYGYVPERNQDRLPFYDYTDRIYYRNTVSLSATNLVTGSFVTGDTTEYRDISRIKFGVDYKIAGERRDLLTLVESQRPWSDLLVESDTWLTREVHFIFDTRFNLSEKNLSTAVAGFEFDDRKGTTAGAGYQMARSQVEYLEGRFSTKTFKPFNLSYTARYSFDRSTFLESVYAVEYTHKCWSVNLAFHQRPDNNSYTVNFNLAGLGSK